MINFKRILNYFIWTVVAFLFGFGHMLIALGGMPKSSTGLMKIFEWIHTCALFGVGSIIGSVIALLFILIDVFYLNERLENNAKSTIIRFLIIIFIGIIVGATHYVLEVVVDVI